MMIVLAFILLFLPLVAFIFFMLVTIAIAMYRIMVSTIKNVKDGDKE